jgi:hypothetical protein
VSRTFGEISYCENFVATGTLVKILSELRSIKKCEKTNLFQFKYRVVFFSREESEIFFCDNLVTKHWKTGNGNFNLCPRRTKLRQLWYPRMGKKWIFIRSTARAQPPSWVNLFKLAFRSRIIFLAGARAELF